MSNKSNAERVRIGLRRLGLASAVLTFVSVFALGIAVSVDEARREITRVSALQCAKEKINQLPSPNPYALTPRELLNIGRLGCGEHYIKADYEEIQAVNMNKFSIMESASLNIGLAFVVATLSVSFLYCLVLTVSWITRGFLTEVAGSRS